MRRSPLSDADASELTPAALVKRSTLVYGVMTIAGVVILRYGHHTLGQALSIGLGAKEFLRLAAIGTLGASLLLVLSYFFEDWFPSFRNLKSVIMRYLGPCSVPMTLYLALITSVGEELLFRGALQPFCGLVLTSVLFGLLHMGKDGLVSAWSIWAFIASLLLGWMYDETGSLWPCIVAHFGVNTVSILGLRRAYRSWVGHLEHEAAGGRGGGEGG